MKKFMVPLVIVAVLVSLIFAGCARPAPTPTELKGWGPMAGVAVKPDGTSHQYAYTTWSLASEFCVTADMVTKTLVERAGGEYFGYDPRGDLGTQTAQIEDMIVMQISGIHILPTDSAGIAPVLDRAFEEGVPVFNMDHKAETDTIINWSTHDQVDCGRVNARHLVAQAEAEGKEYVVYEIIGNLGHEGSERRHEGYHEIFNASPLITVIESPDAQWAPDNAMQFVQDALPANPAINAIVNHNGMVSGCAEALSTLGRLAPIGDPNHVPLYGIDCFPSTMELVRQGFCDGVAVHSPWEEADACVKAMLLYTACGLPVPEVVMFDSYIITLENADSVRFGAPLVWGEMMDQYPNEHDWPILDLPAEYGVVTPTVDMKQEGY